MPRVGSSMISTRGSVAIHFASTTFCWLPPESCFTALLRAARADAEALDRLSSPERAFAAAIDDEGLGDAVEDRERDVLADGLRPDQALQAAILRHIGDLQPPRIVGARDR